MELLLIVFSDGTPWASDDMKVETNADYARAILEQGGWTAGEDGVLVKDGVRASFDLYYSSNDSVRQALAAEFSNQMAAFWYRNSYSWRWLGRLISS